MKMPRFRAGHKCMTSNSNSDSLLFTCTKQTFVLFFFVTQDILQLPSGCLHGVVHAHLLLLLPGVSLPTGGQDRHHLASGQVGLGGGDGHAFAARSAADFKFIGVARSFKTTLFSRFEGTLGRLLAMFFWGTKSKGSAFGTFPLKNAVNVCLNPQLRLRTSLLAGRAGGLHIHWGVPICTLPIISPGGKWELMYTLSPTWHMVI